LASIMLLYAGSQVFLNHVHGHWGQVIAIRQNVEAIPIAADTCPPLRIAIPRRNVLVADGPVYAMPILNVGLEIQVAKSIALPAPCQRTAAHLIPSVPVKPFDFRIRAFFLVDPRSEEHTSELQSRENLVCRLLLEKKKQ